jgi:hypothetical protein
MTSAEHFEFFMKNRSFFLTIFESQFFSIFLFGIKNRKTTESSLSGTIEKCRRKLYCLLLQSKNFDCFSEVSLIVLRENEFKENFYGKFSDGNQFTALNFNILTFIIYIGLIQQYSANFLQNMSECELKIF